MKYLFICVTLALFSSCIIQRRIYSSTQINNPSLQKKNDHSFSLTYSDPSGFDFTGGYAITNRLAIIGGGFIHKNRDRQEATSLFSNGSYVTSLLLYRHKGFHGGLGIYFPLSKKNTANFASFFGGYTIGNFKMNENYQENSALYFYKSNIGRSFLQGSINTNSNGFEASLICRYNYVVYSNVVTDYTADQQYNLNFPPVGYSKFSPFLDVAFDSKYFFTKNRRMGVVLFGSITTRLNRKEFNFYYYPFRIGLGLVVKNPFRKK